MVILGVASQLKAVQSQMNVGRGHGHPLVSIQKWVVLDEAFQECRGLSNRVVVVPGLWAEYGSLESTEVADTIGSSELFYNQSVDDKNLNDREVLDQLLGQLFVKAPVTRYRRLGVGDHLRTGSLTLLSLDPLSQGLVENSLELSTFSGGDTANFIEKLGPGL